MKPYVKAYLDFFGIKSEYVYCEVCGSLAVDIHHIENKKMGGSKTKDTIENLMALCRFDHEKFGDKKQHKEYLHQVHDARIALRKCKLI